MTTLARTVGALHAGERAPPSDEWFTAIRAAADRHGLPAANHMPKRIGARTVRRDPGGKGRRLRTTGTAGPSAQARNIRLSRVGGGKDGSARPANGEPHRAPRDVISTGWGKLRAGRIETLNRTQSRIMCGFTIIGGINRKSAGFNEAMVLSEVDPRCFDPIDFTLTPILPAAGAARPFQLPYRARFASDERPAFDGRRLLYATPMDGCSPDAPLRVIVASTTR